MAAITGFSFFGILRDMGVPLENDVYSVELIAPGFGLEVVLVKTAPNFDGDLEEYQTYLIADDGVAMCSEELYSIMSENMEFPEEVSRFHIEARVDEVVTLVTYSALPSNALDGLSFVDDGA